LDLMVLVIPATELSKPLATELTKPLATGFRCRISASLSYIGLRAGDNGVDGGDETNKRQ